jgi:hypothetical protein
MRRPTLLAALVLAVVLIAAVPVVAAPRATLEASLTGEKEVPGPGDKDGVRQMSRCTKRRCATSSKRSA